jgi:hypothetical protein
MKERRSLQTQRDTSLVGYLTVNHETETSCASRSHTGGRPDRVDCSTGAALMPEALRTVRRARPTSSMMNGWTRGYDTRARLAARGDIVGQSDGRPGYARWHVAPGSSGSVDAMSTVASLARVLNASRSARDASTACLNARTSRRRCGDETLRGETVLYGQAPLATSTSSRFQEPMV